MSSLKDKVEAKVDPRFSDPDFLIALKAREAMNDPCRFQRGAYYGYNLDDTNPARKVARACWGGHLIMASAGLDIWALDVETKLSHKLGFDRCFDLHDFNDSHSHAQVLAEFDKRLASWPNGCTE